MVHNTIPSMIQPTTASLYPAESHASLLHHFSHSLLYPDQVLQDLLEFSFNICNGILFFNYIFCIWRSKYILMFCLRDSDDLFYHHHWSLSDTTTMCWVHKPERVRYCFHQVPTVCHHNNFIIYRAYIHVRKVREFISMSGNNPRHRMGNFGS